MQQQSPRDDQQSVRPSFFFAPFFAVVASAVSAQRAKRAAVVLCVGLGVGVWGLATGSLAQELAERGVDRPIRIALLDDQDPVFREYTAEQNLGFRLGIEFLTEGDMTWQGRAVELSVVPVDEWLRDDDRLPYADELPEQAFWIAPVQGRSAHRALQYGAAYDRVVLVPGSPANELPIADSPLAFRTFYRWQDVDFALFNWGSEQDELIWVSAVESPVTPDFFSVATLNVSPRASGATVVEEIQAVAETMAEPVLASSWPVLLDWLPLLNADVGFDPANMYFWLPDLAALVPLRDSPGLKGLTYYYYDLPANEMNDWLVRTMLAEHDRLPSHHVVAGMTAALALLQGIAMADSVDPNAVAEFMTTLRWQTPRGELSFTVDGETRQPFYRTQLRQQPQLEWARPILFDDALPVWTQP